MTTDKYPREEAECGAERQDVEQERFQRQQHAAREEEEQNQRGCAHPEDEPGQFGSDGVQRVRVVGGDATHLYGEGLIEGADVLRDRNSIVTAGLHVVNGDDALLVSRDVVGECGCCAGVRLAIDGDACDGLHAGDVIEFAELGGVVGRLLGRGSRENDFDRLRLLPVETIAHDFTRDGNRICGGQDSLIHQTKLDSRAEAHESAETNRRHDEHGNRPAHHPPGDGAPGAGVLGGQIATKHLQLVHAIAQ